MQIRVDHYHCVFMLTAWPKWYIDVERMKRVESGYISGLRSAHLYWALQGDLQTPRLHSPVELRNECNVLCAQDECGEAFFRTLRQLALHYTILNRNAATVFAFDFGRPGEHRRRDWFLRRHVERYPRKPQDPALLRELYPR